MGCRDTSEHSLVRSDQAQKGVWYRAVRGIHQPYVGRIVQLFPNSEWCEVLFKDDALSHTVRIADLAPVSAVELLAMVRTE